MGPKKYNNLMTYSEKQWLVKVQLKQLQTDNPYLDDFYFQAFAQRRAQKIQVQAAAEGRPIPQLLVPNTLPGADPPGIHQPANEQRLEVQFDQKTLGHITSFNVRTPRQLIEVIHARPEDAGDEAESAAKLEAKFRRQTLILVEGLFRTVLRIESLDKAAVAIPSPHIKRGMFEERKAGLDAAFALMHVDDRSPTGFLARLIAVRKGMRVLSRILVYLAFPQSAALISSVLSLIIERSGEAVEDCSEFVRAAQRAFQYFPIRVLMQQFEVFRTLAATP
jgi:DNA topoisomerase 2-associated protein PAT1